MVIKRVKCCELNCKINNGYCDTQHKCGGCKGYIHAICGHDYYEDGKLVENLSFPKKCTPCHLASKKDKDQTSKKGARTSPRATSKRAAKKTNTSNGNKEEVTKKPPARRRRNRSKEKNVPTPPAKKKKSDELENDNSSDTVSEKDSDDNEKDDNKSDDDLVEDYFNKDERNKFEPGYFVVDNLKRGELLMEKYSKIPSQFDDRCKLKDKMVNIPATYWGGPEKLRTDQWWKTEAHTDELRKLSADEMEKTLLFGKIIGKGGKGCWEVCLLCAPREISMIYGKDIRNFLYVGESRSATAGGATKNSNQATTTRTTRRNTRGNDLSNNSDEDDLEYDEDELIEEDEFESEDDLQEDDGENTEEEEESLSADESGDDGTVDKDFVRIEPRIKVERKWEVVDDVRETNYSRPITPSFVNPVEINEWKNLSAWDIFKLQLPENELERWAQYTSKNLIKLNQPPIDLKEMKAFIGCLFACTQSRKVGGITKAFETVSDGLFPASDLGRFGMKLRRFQHIMQCWEFADDTQEGIDFDDGYWKTEQLFDRFNEHYAKIVTHGSYVNVDERIFWSYARAQPEGVKICGRKPRGIGQECKTLSCIDMSVTTTFEHVRGNSTNPYTRDLQKDYGKAASVVLRLCQKTKIEGSNRIVIADSWFANLSCYRGLRSLGLQLIGMIKQGDGGFPLQGLIKLLDKEGVDRGSHVTATTTIDNQKVIACAWKGKSDKSRKGKKLKKFWMSTFIASDCTTTLIGPPAEKKRHTPDGRRAPSVFVKRPKLVFDYYNGMPGTDIVNRNAQFLIGLEAAVRSRDIHKRMCCTILGTWMANAYAMAMRFQPFSIKKDITTASFVRDVILGGLFEKNTLPLQLVHGVSLNNDNNSLSTIHGSVSINVTNNNQRNRSTNSSPSVIASPTLPPLPPVQNEIAIGGGTEPASVVHLIDSQSIDPYVHTMQRCSDQHTGQARQQRCVMCNKEGRRSMTSFYCSLCCITANREEDRKPSKHSYCIKPEFNCFSRHVAKCYLHMNRTGIIPQRLHLLRGDNAYNDQQNQAIPIAGRIINRDIPQTRRSDRRNQQSNSRR